MKQRRRSLTAQEIAQKSSAITALFTSLPIYQSAACIMTYLSAFREPDTAALIAACQAAQKKIVVPVTHMDTRQLTLSYLRTPADVIKGAYGISEPMHIVPASESEIDIIIIPGLAFDQSGSRLGFGEGYYDRLLQHTHAYKIGFCYDFQLIEHIPVQRHDIPVDMIITETQVLTLNGGSHAI